MDRVCYLTLEMLKQAPYNLVKDDSVFVKIIAANVYGDSAYSSAFNGAVI